ncbi:MAG: hypothetical protein CL858_31200 [Cupriavidus sp.]|uniref:hypothetical protein n=1 Tax=Cupriavidus pauculus TaxID=82633 RepID=UPI000C567695|nr:hypothetical protein [Cupriavidus pauculus]MBU69843.1 hypothetical protein [Cupriavidus sp.]MBY4729449.1 hypothetical protein [Cupriavidus pauculus]
MTKATDYSVAFLFGSFAAHCFGIVAFERIVIMLAERFATLRPWCRIAVRAEMKCMQPVVATNSAILIFLVSWN